jgi:hypothetical protein
MSSGLISTIDPATKKISVIDQKNWLLPEIFSYHFSVTIDCQPMRLKNFNRQNEQLKVW